MPPDADRQLGPPAITHRILHVLPYDQPRGAQRYARDLVDHLESGPEYHQILTVFRGEASSLRPDIAIDLPRGRARSLGFDPRAIPEMRRAVKVLAPDLVIAHGGEAAKYSVFAIRRTTPLVYLNIGSMHPRLGRRRSSLLHRYYTRRADIVVAVSRFLAEEATSVTGVPDEKVVVIPNGRDASVFAPSPSGEQAEQLRLIWIGQLDDTKRPELMIELVRVLRGEGFEIRARMVGDGPRRADLVESARAAGVEMLGHRDDVPSLLRDSDILVFTGRPPEGMPGVLIEAGLCGVAAVSTRVPGADEVIQEGVTGRLVDIDDVSGLIDHVRNLALDDEAREKMGRSARLRCVENFSFEATAVKWQELFTRLLGHGTSPSS